jgi:hypothetical protein
LRGLRFAGRTDLEGPRSFALSIGGDAEKRAEE